MSGSCVGDCSGNRSGKTWNVKRVPLKDGPDPRICYGIFKENESERPQIAAFMKEFIRQAEKMPEIRVLKAAG